jgi:hypothetical protein
MSWDVRECEEIITPSASDGIRSAKARRVARAERGPLVVVVAELSVARGDAAEDTIHEDPVEDELGHVQLAANRLDPVASRRIGDVLDEGTHHHGLPDRDRAHVVRQRPRGDPGDAEQLPGDVVPDHVPLHVGRDGAVLPVSTCGESRFRAYAPRRVCPPPRSGTRGKDPRERAATPIGRAAGAEWVRPAAQRWKGLVPPRTDRDKGVTRLPPREPGRELSQIAAILDLRLDVVRRRSRGIASLKHVPAPGRGSPGAQRPARDRAAPRRARRDSRAARSAPAAGRAERPWPPAPASTFTPQHRDALPVSQPAAVTRSDELRCWGSMDPQTHANGASASPVTALVIG